MILALVLGAACADRSEPVPQPETSVVPVAAPTVVSVGYVEPVKLKQGSTETIRLPLEIADGHRIQANPVSNQFLVPLTLELSGVDGVVPGPVLYPEGEPYRLEGSDELLSTYLGQIEILVPVSVAGAASPGTHRLAGELRFQACNSTMCLFPDEVDVAIEIEVEH